MHLFDHQGSKEKEKLRVTMIQTHAISPALFTAFTRTDLCILESFYSGKLNEEIQSLLKAQALVTGAVWFE